MICPVCKESLIVLELDQVEIDFCTECHGIWLDSGELEILLGNTEAALAFIAHFDSLTSVKEDRYKCPICNSRMEKIQYTDPQSPVLDRCVKNHGIWFDSGELERVLNSDAEENSMVLNLIRDMLGQNN